MQTFLEFEKPVQTLVEQIDKLKEVAEKGEVDVSATLKDLEKKLVQVRKELYGDLTPWQRVQVSRHPERPYTLHYIQKLSEGSFIELHGDRTVRDDKAMVGGFGMLAGRSVMFIGQQKGVNTKMRQYRNFGMANPEGYRKALRLMKLAEKFGRPVVTFIDTPGAFPGLEAEERGQGEAIARNLFEMMRLRVPVVCIIIGEGASGGALGIGIGDKVLMLENAWYSVISPENCSTILWRTWDFKEKAAQALKLTAEDMLANKLIDGIVPEPLGGAHTDPDKAAEMVKAEVVKWLDKLGKTDADKLVERRIRKFCNMGVVERAKPASRSKKSEKAKAPD
ncbi:MAG: acetyl-CoA carboxylase carboxyltransferase subunit alpha [Flavobacteriales bacterium]|nr:acetyl-CoA carboxylase carboxyltransferase subunit alpha [Flavobacteriales bacterium]MCB9167665.1 acetyl-CoA carboxylase carboxyltransferase subunit alpha [Flavobacteriales bacterium]